VALPTYGLGQQTALWHRRWPLIALDECVEQVAAAPAGEKENVRWNLPCESCPVNTACLTGKLKEITPLMYDREYLTKPRSSQSSLFPYERMEPCFNYELSLVDGYKKPIGIESRYAVVSGWDFAWSERAGGDYIAVYTALLDRRTMKKRPLVINRWQRLTFMEQCNLVIAHHQAYREDLVCMESDMAQIVWKQYVEYRSNVPVLAHSSGDKADLMDGIPILLRDIDAKRWEIPMARDGYLADQVKVWLGECEAFGWQDDKLQGVGEHDDTVLAWWHCDWGLEKMRIPEGAPTDRSERRGREF
jgi:hypothetical protein